MLTNPFGRKSNKVQKILKLGDQLSLSLRENVELIDTDDSLITFVTESGHVIEGEFDFDTLEFSNINVTTTEIFEDSESFDSAITDNISSVLGSLLEDNRKEASTKFNKILHLWEARSKYDRVIERLQERKERYNLYASIVESEQFSVLNELKPQLIKFLSENRDELKKVREILSSVKLSNTISTAFNLPQINAEDLHEGTFHVVDRRFDSVYDVVCRQELIKKDLVENKKAFNALWLNSNEVNSLIDFMGKKNDAGLSEALATIINDNPYFALATKKQLFELVENSLSFQDVDAFSKKEIKDFVSRIYEAKKSVKDMIVENLNDKYGINIQNLKTTPSFGDLGKTQRVVFESLHKLAPRGSALKTALGEFSKVLGLHSGVDVIDINEWLVDIFVDSQYSELINETSLLNYMNFDKVAGDLSKIGQVLKMIQAGMGGEMGGEMGGGMEGMAGGGMPEDGQYEADGSGEEDMMSAMQGGEEEEGEEEMGDGDMEDEAMPDEGEDGDLPEESPEEAAMGAEEDMEAEAGEGDEMGDEDPESGQMEEDEFMSYLEDLEGLIDSLKANMGVGDEGGEEEMGDEEEGMEGEEEGEEEMPEEEPSEEEDMGDEEEEGEEEEEEMPPKKGKKPFPPKE